VEAVEPAFPRRCPVPPTPREVNQARERQPLPYVVILESLPPQGRTCRNTPPTARLLPANARGPAPSNPLARARAEEAARLRGRITVCGWSLRARAL